MADACPRCKSADRSKREYFFSTSRRLGHYCEHKWHDQRDAGDGEMASGDGGVTGSTADCGSAGGVRIPPSHQPVPPAASGEPEYPYTKAEYRKMGHIYDRVQEECAELIVAIAKARRFGLENFHPATPKTDNADAILHEVEDVRRVCAELVRYVIDDVTEVR